MLYAWGATGVATLYKDCDEWRVSGKVIIWVRMWVVIQSPQASRFGGALERQIGTIGRTLDAMLLELGSQQLTHELHDTLTSEAAAIVNAHPITAILADINEPHPLPPAMLLPQTTCRLDTLLGSFTSQDLWPKEMEKGLTSCRPVLDQMEMWAYHQSANQDKMDPGDMELNSQRRPDEERAGPLKQLAPGQSWWCSQKQWQKS